MQFVRAVIVGSGSSSSTPSLSCLASGTPCATCLEAREHPHTSRNNRHNPSLLIQLRHPVDQTIHNVLIDCGKTFRQSALKVFPEYGVSDLSGLLLTHEHADACFGLDDLRDYNRKDDPAGGLDVFADRATLLSCHRAFHYLFPKVTPATPAIFSGGSGGQVQAEETEAAKNALVAQLTSTVGVGSGWNFRATGATWTATLSWHVMRPMELIHLPIRQRRAGAPGSEAEGAEAAPSAVATWPFIAVPVLHGRDYYSEAFLFRMDSAAADGASASPRLFFYCSDVSCVDAAFHERLRTAKQLLLLPTASTTGATAEALEAAASTPLEVLVLDLLTWNSHYSTHLCGEDALAAAQELDAKHTFFVGLSHSVSDARVAAELEKRGLQDRMSAAYDGCLAAGAPVPPREVP